MKVYIGPYVDRWVSYVHDHYMHKKYGWDWPEYGQKGLSNVNEPYVEFFLRKTEDTLQWIYNHTINPYLDRKERKIKVRIDPYDTWSTDHTLAVIILPALKQLKETKHGAPLVDLEDVPKDLRPTKAELKKYNKDGETDSKFFERWNWVMDEMIWAFEQKCRDDWEEDYYGQYIEGPDGEPLSGHFEWTDDEGRKKHHDRMSNGFRLFGKYYESLWD